MTLERIYTYEGLFLFPQSAAANLQAAADQVKELLGRIDAEIISFSKWDERKLAYEIKGNKRGVYFLTYFKAHADKLTTLDRACNLSEQLLRYIVTRADLIPAENIAAADGQSQLADEIKLRSEQVTEKGTLTETSRVESRSEIAAAVEAKSKTASEPKKEEAPAAETKPESAPEAKSEEAPATTDA